MVLDLHNITWGVFEHLKNVFDIFFEASGLIRNKIIRSLDIW